MQNLQTPLNTREMRSNRIEIASFSEELQKNHPAAGGEAPTTPSVARFSYTTEVYSTHLSIQTFSLYICWFKTSLLSRIYTGDFFATRFDDFSCVKISLAKRLLTRGKTRLPRSRLARVAAV